MSKNFFLFCYLSIRLYKVASIACKGLILPISFILWNAEGLKDSIPQPIDPSHLKIRSFMTGTTEPWMWMHQLQGLGADSGRRGKSITGFASVGKATCRSAGSALALRA
jgi:hypothetical protein